MTYNSEKIDKKLYCVTIKYILFTTWKKEVEKLVAVITKLIENHHKLYPRLPVNGLYWENILKTAIEEVYNESVGWEPGSHCQGADLFTEEFGDISCKGGTWKNDKMLGWILNFSGSRTTKCETIEEKKEYLKVKAEDVYFCLSRNEKEWKDGETKYYLAIFDTLEYTDLDWKETMGQRGKNKGKLVGWHSQNENMKVKIQKQMSDQLWTSLKEDAIEQIYPITIG